MPTRSEFKVRVESIHGSDDVTVFVSQRNRGEDMRISADGPEASIVVPVPEPSLFLSLLVGAVVIAGMKRGSR